MSKQQISPGEWKITDTNVHLFDCTDNEIPYILSAITDVNGDSVTFVDNMIADETALANARAIVEIPGMLKMLKQFEIDLLLWPELPMKQNRASKLKGLLDRIDGEK